MDRGLYRYLSQMDRHLSGWKQQGGPRATYFVSPLHQDVAMIYVSREMFTIGGGHIWETNGWIMIYVSREMFIIRGGNIFVCAGHLSTTLTSLGPFIIVGTLHIILCTHLSVGRP